MITEDDLRVFEIEQVGPSVLHKTDGTVIAEGVGAFAEPGRGQRFSYIRPGGVLVRDDGGVRKAVPWATDFVPTFAELIGR
jgi:hypothetical protein